MAKGLSFALFNYERGGLSRSGQYDFAKLRQAFEPVKESPPDIILINEARGWQVDGNTALYAAANALAESLGRGYVGEVGFGDRGYTATPALVYDPQVARLDFWGNSHEAVHDDRRNFAKMHRAGKSALRFCLSIQHWNPEDGDLRIIEAHKTKAIVSGPPTLLGGDLNNPASGPHMPKADWSLASERLRKTKALLLPDGMYIDDTRAMDLMLGDWDAANQRRTNAARAFSREAIGWHALAELARQNNMLAERAFMPTVNRGPSGGGGMLIDWLLVNEAWKEGLVPDTYTVHVPADTDSRGYPSDHRLVTATLEL